MYSILNISAETVDLFKSCFESNGSQKSLAKIRWQFLESHLNQQFVDIAVDSENNKTAAIYAIAPVQFHIKREVFTGSQSLDTITDKDYRGQGLFIKLAKDVYRKAEEQGVKVVYGFPNGSSIHGFRKKLGWQVLDPVPFLIKPLQSRYFTKKIKALSWLPNIQLAYNTAISKEISISENFDFPDEVDEIWNSFAKNIEIAVHRNKEYLTWRYLKKPGENYKILHAYAEAGEYIGYLVYCVKEKHGGKVAYIMEYVYRPDRERLATNLLKTAINHIIDQKADCILAWCMTHSPNYQLFHRSRFITMPERLRPIELHFGARSFDASLDSIIYNRQNWYLSYSDSDTV